MPSIKVKYYMDNGLELDDGIELAEEDLSREFNYIKMLVKVAIKQTEPGHIIVGHTYVDASKLVACRVTMED